MNIDKTMILVGEAGVHRLSDWKSREDARWRLGMQTSNKVVQWLVAAKIGRSSMLHQSLRSNVDDLPRTMGMLPDRYYPCFLGDGNASYYFNYL